METLRLTAPPEDRQRLLALQVDHYRWLLERYVRTGQPWQALAVSEVLKARNLREALSQKAGNLAERSTQVDRLRTLQSRLPADLAVVSYANADWSRSNPIAFVLTAQKLEVVRLSLALTPEIVALLPAEDVLAAQRKAVDASHYHLDDEITLAGLVAYFRATIYCDHDQMAALYPSSIVTEKLLHYLLMAPIEPVLDGFTRLLISPSGLLAYMPFDAWRKAHHGHSINRLPQYCAYALALHHAATSRTHSRPPPRSRFWALAGPSTIPRTTRKSWRFRRKSKPNSPPSPPCAPPNLKALAARMRVGRAVPPATWPVRGSKWNYSAKFCPDLASSRGAMSANPSSAAWPPPANSRNPACPILRSMVRPCPRCPTCPASSFRGKARSHRKCRPSTTGAGNSPIFPISIYAPN